MAADELGYRPFDADNHYYEGHDAFTRHVEPAMQPRVVQWVETDNGRKHHLVGGRISRAVVNPTWNPIAKPGALNMYFKGNPEKKSPLEYLQDREPTPPEYLDRDARISCLERQGLSGIWLFPTLGVLYEELLKTDLAAVVALMRGFNEWLHEDWGFDHRDRIFAAPYIALADVDAAVRELELSIDRGARVVVMRPAPVTTLTGVVSPFNTSFDPFWARLNESGLTLVVHASDSGYSTQGYATDRFSAAGMSKVPRPSIKMFNIERAAQDWLMQATFEKIFTRFPNLRFASVENGADFLAPMFRKLDQAAKKSFSWFDEDPVQTFKRHVWINPFWEDDVSEVTALMGSDRVIFGSDWPHIEGLPAPLDYAAELEGFPADDRRRILLDNVTHLNTPQPV